MPIAHYPSCPLPITPNMRCLKCSTDIIHETLKNSVAITVVILLSLTPSKVLSRKKQEKSPQKSPQKSTQKSAFF